MRYHALACDYDGTIAAKGLVNAETVDALERLKTSGRKLILVTGRQLDDLLEAFPSSTIFDRIVAENGALVYDPATREEYLLSSPPPEDFIVQLSQRHVHPVSVGKIIVATQVPNETIVLDIIRELGLELHVIFNKGAVMVLPSGINKATGLLVALDQLLLSPHNVVGVGDAENDHAFLTACELSVAVSNALDSLKGRSDHITISERDEGVIELIDQLIESDLHEIEPKLSRHEILLGKTSQGRELCLSPYGSTVLLAGTSGSGKSTLATGFLEGLQRQEYQFCIIDPEGDYQNMDDAIVLGDMRRAPVVKEAVQVLDKPNQNCVVNLLGISREHRPAFFDQLLGSLLELRRQVGRPHWIIIDEAHHLLPSSWAPASQLLPHELNSLMLITVHPDHVTQSLLTMVDLMLAVGESPEETIGVFGESVGLRRPDVPRKSLDAGEAVAWWTKTGERPFIFTSIPPTTEHQRHVRKYATGELPPERSFYFRGPEGKLNLRAQNLEMFMQLSDGIDDETWLFHLRQGDISQWFRNAIKDDELATAIEAIEKSNHLSADESRNSIKKEIEERYTSPA